MIEFDGVSLKRKIIACIILAIPAFYYTFTSAKINHDYILNELFYCAFYGVGFLFVVMFLAGMVALAIIIIYGTALLIAKLLLNTKITGIAEAASTIGCLSIVLTYIYLSLVAFGINLPFVKW